MNIKLAKTWSASESLPTLAGPAAQSLIGRNLRIKGALLFSGQLLVEGEIHGSVSCDDSNDSLLRLAETGVIEGDVHVVSATISGHIRGNVHATRHLSLSSKAVIHGDVKYRELEIAQGAVVDGRLIFEGESAGS